MAEIKASEAEEGTTYTTNRGVAVLILGRVEGSDDVHLRDVDTQRELTVPPSYPLMLIPDGDSDGPAALVGADRSDMEPALVSLTVDQLHELLDLDQRLWVQAAVADAIAARSGATQTDRQEPTTEPTVAPSRPVNELAATGVGPRTIEIRRLTSQGACQATLDWYDADKTRKLEAKVRVELERLIKWHGQVVEISTSKAKLTQAAKLKRYNDPLRSGILAHIRRLLAALDGDTTATTTTEEAPAPTELAGPSMADSLHAADLRVMDMWLSARWHGPFDLETIEALTGGVRICRSAIALLRAQPRRDEADVLAQAWAWARWGGGQEASDTVRDQIAARARAVNVILHTEAPPPLREDQKQPEPAPYDSLWVTVKTATGSIRCPGGVQAMPSGNEVTIWWSPPDGERACLRVNRETMSTPEVQTERSDAAPDPTMGGLLTLDLSLKIALESFELRPPKFNEVRTELERWVAWLIARPGHEGAQMENELQYVIHKCTARDAAAAADRIREMRLHKPGADPSTWPAIIHVDEPKTPAETVLAEIKEGDIVLLAVELHGEATGEEWNGVVMDATNNLLEVSWVGYELAADPKGTGSRLRRLFETKTGARFCAPKENVGGRKLRLIGLAPETPLSHTELLERAGKTAAQHILAVSKEAGDARPTSYMSGRNGLEAEPDMTPTDAALWALGRADLDIMIKAGVVVEEPTADPAKQDFAERVATASIARALELVAKATSRSVLRLAWQAEDAAGKRSRILDAIESRRNELRADQDKPRVVCQALVPAGLAHAGERCDLSEPHTMADLHKCDNSSWEGQVYHSPSGSLLYRGDPHPPAPTPPTPAPTPAPAPTPPAPTPTKEILVEPKHLKLVAKPDGTDDLYHCLPGVAPRYLGPAAHPSLAPVVAQLRALTPTHIVPEPSQQDEAIDALGALGRALWALKTLGLKVNITITE